MSPSQGGHRALGTVPPDCCRQRRRLSRVSVPGALRPGRGWAGLALRAALSEMGGEPGSSPLRLHRAGSAQRPRPLPTPRPAARLCRVPSGQLRRALQVSCSYPGHLPPFILPGSPRETPSRPLSPPRRHSSSFTLLPGHPLVQWLPWAGCRLHVRGMLVGRGRARPSLLKACTRLGGRRCRTDVTFLSPSPGPAGLGHLLWSWC